jgi:phospholipase/lecithinase/hemolysin
MARERLRRFIGGRRSSLAIAAGLIFVALGGTGALAAPFAVPNPYATGPGDNDITVRRLTVFGDSYSKLKRKAYRNWAEQLRYDETNPNSGLPLVRALAGFAVSGATAGTYPGSTNDFALQVTRWLAKSPVFGARDLTVVYFGYNDLKLSTDASGGDLNGAMADYRAALQRIVSAGAGGGSRRVLLVMPHDWGRSPRYVANGQWSVMRQRTEVWNGFLAGLAEQNSFTRLVALDLFTAMECVFNQPGDFGLTDVTKPRPQGADPAKYLYDLNDDIHFGPRGQALIRQVVQHYLTRGWDWSNTHKDPTAARQRLTADLEAGEVFGVPCDPYPAALAEAG